MFPFSAFTLRHTAYNSHSATFKCENPHFVLTPSLFRTEMSHFCTFTNITRAFNAYRSHFVFRCHSGLA